MDAKVVKNSFLDMIDFRVFGNKLISPRSRFFPKKLYFCRIQKKQVKSIQNEYVIRLVKRLYCD